MARLANIVSKCAKSIDPRRHLTCGDVAVTSHGLLVNVQKRFNLESVFSTFLTSQFAVMPCFCLFTHDSFSSRSPIAFCFFLILGPKGLVHLTKRRFVSSFRLYLVAAGISNVQSFRDHSF